MTRVQVQGNPTLDKPSQRLELAGAGQFGPILKGLAGHVAIDLDSGEVLDDVRIFSVDGHDFSKVLSGTFTNLGEGKRRWGTDIIFGQDTDYGRPGESSIRNFLQWKIHRKKVLNPSGPSLLEKAYTSGDSTALRGASDATLRKNRSFFSPRDYSLAFTGSVSDSVIEASGLAWREDDQSLFVISDDLKLAIVDRSGNLLQPVISMPAALGLNDTESIVYMGSDRFAILDEGVFLSRSPKIVLFHLRSGDQEIDAAFSKSYTLSKVEEFSGGFGAEAIAYDRVTEKFYVGTQSTTTGEGGLWEVDIHDRDTDGEATQTLLYRWFDTLVDPGHLGAGAILGDLCFSNNLAGGQTSLSIFAQFRTPDVGGPIDQRQIIQMDLLTGAHINSFNHSREGKYEGFDIDSDSESFFIVREGAGDGLHRFDHTKFEEAHIFRRQFFVADLPTKGALYLNGQEAQFGEAWVFINSTDINRFSRDATIGINILPTMSDEFFLQHEYPGNIGERSTLREFVAGELVAFRGGKRPNRFAHTLRNVGGAATVEILLDGHLSVSEMNIEDLGGLYWPTPSFGQHTITLRLRAENGSSHFVDVDGFVRFRQFACPS